MLDLTGSHENTRLDPELASPLKDPAFSLFTIDDGRFAFRGTWSTPYWTSTSFVPLSSQEEGS